MWVVLVDYDSGNLYLVQKVVVLMGCDLGVEVLVILDLVVVCGVDWIVLLGDGVFLVCKVVLDVVLGMVEVLEDVVLMCGVFFMGICVGMQMLVGLGYEYCEMFGFGWIGGEICVIDVLGLKVLYMGWNDLVVRQVYFVLEGVVLGDYVYFVYSWQFQVVDFVYLLVVVDYGGQVMVVVGCDNIVGCQFYFEKLQVVGLCIIVNFLCWCF